MFYNILLQVDMMRGADATMLEEKLKKLYSEEEGDDGDSPVKGHVSLSN